MKTFNSNYKVCLTRSDYRSTNYGTYTAQYTVVYFLAACFVAGDRRQNCDVIIILHHATHFEDL